MGYDKKNGPCTCWQWSPEDVVAAAGAYSAVLAMDRDKKTAVAVACNYGLVNVQDIGFSMLEHDVQ